MLFKDNIFFGADHSVLDRLSSQSDDQWANEAVKRSDLAFSTLDIDFETFYVGNVVTDESLARQAVDKMDFSCNFTEAGLPTIVAGEIDIDYGVFVGNMNFIPQSADFDRRNFLNNSVRVLELEKRFFEARHATS